MNSKDEKRLEELKLGYYVQKDNIVKVVLSKNNRKIALRLNEHGFFHYEKGLIFKIFPNHMVDNYQLTAYNDPIT